MNSLKILIIQNTPYHFETTISLYSSLLRLQPNKLSIVQIDKDHTDQRNFLQKHNIDTIPFFDPFIYDYDIAFIISAYPNPYVSINDSIPLMDHPVIQHYKNRLIFICHRFDRASDFIKHPFVKLNNSLSLSILSKNNIHLDYWYPIEYPVEPAYQTKNNYCIQGHFEFNNRQIFSDIVNNNEINKYELYIIGTTTNKIRSNKSKYLSNLREIDFYNALNNQKFILAMIDDKIRNGTYINQRFSSNFNHAAALEKPIFCHEVFQNIYEIPGIYYNNQNVYEKFQQLVNMSEIEYSKLVSSFKSFKDKYYHHNNNILSQKIEYLLNNV